MLHWITNPHVMKSKLQNDVVVTPNTSKQKPKLLYLSFLFSIYSFQKPPLLTNQNYGPSTSPIKSSLSLSILFPS